MTSLVYHSGFLENQMGAEREVDGVKTAEVTTEELWMLWIYRFSVELPFDIYL